MKEKEHRYKKGRPGKGQIKQDTERKRKRKNKKRRKKEIKELKKLTEK